MRALSSRDGETLPGARVGIRRGGESASRWNAARCGIKCRRSGHSEPRQNRAPRQDGATRRPYKSRNSETGLSTNQHHPPLPGRLASRNAAGAT